jgi:PAS domain S-box-containing protein
MASAIRPDDQRGFEPFEQLPDAILVVDRQGIIRYANRQAGRLFGQEPAALVSAPIEALLPEQLRNCHIGHRAKYSAEPSLRPMGTGLEPAGRRADGTTFPVDVVLNPIKHLDEPMVLAIVRDATARRVAEEDLRECRTMFEKLYEHSPDALVVVDETGKIDRVNAQAEALFGLPRERMLGQSIEMLVPERLRERHLAHRVSYMNAPKTRPMGTDLPLLAQRADGSEFPVDISLSPIEIDERRVVLAVLRDITERKRAEAQMQLLLREVNHRAKNILSVVQAIAQRTLASSSEEFISRFSERIQGLSLSNDLLIRNQWQNVPLAELVHSQLAHFEDLLESRIAVRGPDLRITAGAAQVIGMALHELATNAGKYGALSTDTGRVDIVWRVEPAAGAAGHHFMMEWSENGGPTVVAPTRHGFGWSVLCELTKVSLGAHVTLEYPPTGVVWHLECPADQVREDDAAQMNVVASSKPTSNHGPELTRRTKRPFSAGRRPRAPVS